uniref:Integrin beta subunit cytoplasmic domain-containing protein n=1 Tax=Meleagris gallopavo TaxID=9103 RepID=A0A803YMD4_MELGA
MSWENQCYCSEVRLLGIPPQVLWISAFPLTSSVPSSTVPVSQPPRNKLISFSPSFPECSSAPSAVTIVLAVIGSVVLIGTILLGLWKLLVTIHDRREFDRFQSERTRARYEMPISTHNVEFTFNKLNKSYNGTVD